MTAATASTSLSFSPPPTENPTLLNLLIVEAECTLRDAYREVASDMGYRTSGAESIEQALRLTDSQTLTSFSLI